MPANQLPQLPAGCAYLTAIDLDGEGGNIVAVLVEATRALHFAGWGTGHGAMMACRVFESASYDDALHIIHCHAPVRFVRDGKPWSPSAN